MILKLILGMVIILGVGNAYQYITGKWAEASYKKEITELQNAQAELKITEAKQAAEIERLKNKQVIKRRVSHAQEKVNVDVGDPTAVVNFFRVRRKGSIPDSPNAEKGGS